MKCLQDNKNICQFTLMKYVQYLKCKVKEQCSYSRGGIVQKCKKYIEKG